MFAAAKNGNVFSNVQKHLLKS